jgi:hypothetical protein
MEKVKFTPNEDEQKSLQNYTEWEKTKSNLKLKPPVLKQINWARNESYHLVPNKLQYLYTGYKKPFACYTITGTWHFDGDMIQLYVLPGQGAKRWAGVNNLWISEFGIGDTPEEAKSNYGRFNWVSRSKSVIKLQLENGKIKPRQ